MTSAAVIPSDRSWAYVSPSRELAGVQIDQRARTAIIEIAAAWQGRAESTFIIIQEGGRQEAAHRSDPHSQREHDPLKGILTCAKQAATRLE